MGRYGSIDLSAPLELSDTRTVLEDGLALQLYVDDRCGDVVGFASQLCSGQHVQTTFSSITSQTFWVNITGIENDQHCIMTKATTDKQISSLYATFEVTRLKGEDQLHFAPSSRRVRFN